MSWWFPEHWKPVLPLSGSSQKPPVAPTVRSSHGEMILEAYPIPPWMVESQPLEGSSKRASASTGVEKRRVEPALRLPRPGPTDCCYAIEPLSISCLLVVHWEVSVMKKQWSKWYLFIEHPYSNQNHRTKPKVPMRCPYSNSHWVSQNSEPGPLV